MGMGSGRLRHAARRARLVALLALGLLAIQAAPAPGSDRAEAASTDSRYSLAGGCFALRSEARDRFVVKSGAGYAASASSAAAAERFRMQATDLGRYLFYGHARDFLARNLLNGISSATQPSDNSDWTVRKEDGIFRVSNGFAGRDLTVAANGNLASAAEGAAGAAGRFSFRQVDGCAAYPEVEINVTGGPSARKPPYVETRGLLEGHMHQMAFEFLGGRAHCGRPWHRFGAPYALVDCLDHQPTGCTAVLENVLFGNPARCHDPTGWPTFKDWPHPQSLTHEQSYYRWLERAHRGGLRIFVNLLVENRVLCELYPLKQNSCDEMDSVRLQARRIREMERYIDAQNGGPGRGWFRIVDDPFEARHVINAGKLAVILGMEVSEPFGCRLLNEVPQCTAAGLDAGIDELYDLGVRQLELINKFDNALAGVAGDGGSTGTITNQGNFASTGRYWNLEHCDDQENHDHSPTGLEHNDDELIGNGLLEFLPPGTLPVYPPPPHCNTMGLTDLGERAIRRILAKGMLFDPDHMSVKARNEAMDVVESVKHPGVISSHSWSTPNALRRVSRLGGVITPYAGNAESFVHEWRHVKAYEREHDGQFFGLGWGADQNGFGGQGNPRGAGAPNPVTYPFQSFDGTATIHRQRSGERLYDINVDGVAHYGLYPDWVEDLRQLAGDEIIRDLGRGSEAYLQNWERALGVRGSACRPWRGRVRRAGVGRSLRLGERPKQTLFRAGQPERRFRAWKWCVRQRPGARKQKMVAVFNKHRRLALILSDVPAVRTARVHRGSPRAALPERADPIGDGVFVRRLSRGRSLVFVVRRGKVRSLGVAGTYVALDRPILRHHLRLAGVR